MYIKIETTSKRTIAIFASKLNAMMTGSDVLSDQLISIELLRDKKNKKKQFIITSIYPSDDSNKHNNIITCITLPPVKISKINYATN